MLPFQEQVLWDEKHAGQRLVIQIHGNLWYPGQLWHHSGEGNKGTHPLNKLVYLFSFWFCRIVLWPRSQKSISREKKITLYSALANSVFLPRLCKTDLLSFAGSSSCHCFSLASGYTCPWFTHVSSALCCCCCCFPLQSLFFNFSLLFTAAIPNKLFPFLPTPPAF